jgi:hypothetical protein
MLDNAEIKRARMLFIQGKMSEELFRKFLNRNSGNGESIDLTMQFNEGSIYNDSERNDIDGSLSAKN